MAVTLTAAAVAKLKPAEQRREIPDGGCPTLYLLIHPSGAKSWAMRFRRPSGKSAKLTLGSCDTTAREIEGEPAVGGHLTLAAARRLASEMRREIALGRDPAAEHKKEKQRRKVAAVANAENTFGVYVRNFFSEYKIPKKGRKPRRWREIARVLGLEYPAAGGEPTETKGGLAARWRDKPVAEFDCDDVSAVVDEARRVAIPGLSPRNSGMSDARGRKMADALGAFFKWLKGQPLSPIRANPCLGSFRPGPSFARDRVLNARADVRRADELRWFWAACDGLAEPFGDLLRLLLLTGCRLSEIAHMENDELADDAATLRLPGARTKNGLPHEIALPPLAVAILARRRRERPSSSKYLFPSTGGQAPGRRPVSGFSKIKKQLDAAMLAAAVKEKGDGAAIAPWRIHDLRRSAATGIAGIGIPPHIVEACLNHISGVKAGDAGTYNRETYDPERKAALRRWAGYVEGLATERAAIVVDLQRARA